MMCRGSKKGRNKYFHIVLISFLFNQCVSAFRTLESNILSTTSLHSPRPYCAFLSDCHQHAATRRHTQVKLCAAARRSSKWDNIEDDDDDDVLAAYNKSIPRDMRYVQRVIERQGQNFDAIRQAAGKDLSNDVYIQEPNSDIFWFVGKVARVSDVTLEQAIARQYPLIEQHGSYLRPVELLPHRGELDIWAAPGDSELEVAYNRPHIVFQKMSRDVEGAADIKVNMVGFQGEVYEGDWQGDLRMGFRTTRTQDGKPAKPEIQSPSVDAGDKNEDYSEEKYEAPTDDQLAELQKMLEGQDINEVYEEQQRKEGKDL